MNISSQSFYLLPLSCCAHSTSQVLSMQSNIWQLVPTRAQVGGTKKCEPTLHTLYFWRRLCILAAHFTSAVPESTKSLIRACLLPRPASPPPAVLEGGQTKASSCPTSDVTCNGPAPDMAPQLRQACLDISNGTQNEERNVYKKITIRISAQPLIQFLYIWFMPLCH